MKCWVILWHGLVVQSCTCWDNSSTLSFLISPTNSSTWQKWKVRQFHIINLQIGPEVQISYKWDHFSLYLSSEFYFILTGVLFLIFCHSYLGQFSFQFLYSWGQDTENGYTSFVKCSYVGERNCICKIENVQNMHGYEVLVFFIPSKCFWIQNFD